MKSSFLLRVLSIVLLTATALFSLCACGGTVNNPESARTNEVETLPPQSGQSGEDASETLPTDPGSTGETTDGTTGKTTETPATETLSPEPTAVSPDPVSASGEQTSFEPAAERIYDITVWIDEDALQLTKSQIEAFNAANFRSSAGEIIRFNAILRAVHFSEAAYEMTKYGADLYCFSQSGLERLVKAGLLSQLSSGAVKTVSENNTSSAVSAGNIDSAQYGFPMSICNGYFLYYDKSVIPQEDVGSLEKILADCKKTNRSFCMEIEASAWYAASFFFATGCRSDWSVDENGIITGVSDTFNSENGLISAKAIKKLVVSEAHRETSRGTAFSDGAAALVTGIWEYETIKQILGDNLGAAALPSFTENGQTYRLGSYGEFRLLGVKPQKDAGKAEALELLAGYLSGAECQTQRYNALGNSWGPTALSVIDSPEVWNNEALSALIEQSLRAVPQGQIYGGWWDTAKTLVIGIKNASDEAGIKAALESYEKALQGMIAKH